MINTQTAPSSHHPDSNFLVAQPAMRRSQSGSAVILVATDGSERADGAIRVAVERAEATGATVEVLTVVQTEPILASEYVLFEEHAVLTRRSARRRVVEEQLERVLGRDQVVSITVLEGNPAFTISRIAVERRAALLVMGIGRHLVAHRLFSDETALQVARIARVPVLAVPAQAQAAPRRAVVAVDFSDLSARAAQAAVDAMGDGGEVHLVHVMPLVLEDPFTISAQEPHERWANVQLESLISKLAVPAGVSVKYGARRGRPAVEILDYAEKIGADLVATGTHGRGFVARTILGSVTTQLLRGATCSLLALPRDPLPAIAPSTRDDVAGGSINAPLAWSRMMNEFTRRNFSRRTILEVDDLEIGAQAQEYNYPLLGASYSERDRRLEIMLGDRQSGGRHLSRSIGSVVSIDVLTDGAGTDIALRVQHGTSQTLLTFTA
ncbi:MAG: universal stress protein [bacterium]